MAKTNQNLTIEVIVRSTEAEPNKETGKCHVTEVKSTHANMGADYDELTKIQKAVMAAMFALGGHTFE